MTNTGQRSKPTSRKRRLHPKALIRDALRCGRLWSDTAEVRAGFKVSEATLCWVLTGLVEYHGKDGKMYPSNSRLAADLHLSGRQVITARKCLEAMGLIRCTVRGGRANWQDDEFVFSPTANVYQLNGVMLTKYREAYLRERQAEREARDAELIEKGAALMERVGLAMPTETVSHKPSDVSPNNTPLSDTTVEDSGVCSFEDDSEADPRHHQPEAKPPTQPKQGQVGKRVESPVLYKQTKPSRWKHTREEVLAALIAAGCTEKRAAEWFKRPKPDRKTGLFAPRYGFDDLRADAAEWYERDWHKDSNGEAEALTQEQFSKRQQEERGFNAKEWKRHPDGKFRRMTDAERQAQAEEAKERVRAAKERAEQFRAAYAAAANKREQDRIRVEWEDWAQEMAQSGVRL